MALKVSAYVEYFTNDFNTTVKVEIFKVEVEGDKFHYFYIFKPYPYYETLLYSGRVVNTEGLVFKVLPNQVFVMTTEEETVLFRLHPVTLQKM